MHPLTARFRPADPFLRDRSVVARAEAKYARRSGKVRTLHVASAARCQEDLGRLPDTGEAFHVIIGRRWSVAALPGVVLALAGGETIDRLTVATLSYGRPFLVEMIGHLDAGRVRRLSLLASVFFEAHNDSLWAESRDELAKRGQTLAAGRTHAKVMCFALSGGRRLVAEGSANLRSCADREQLMLANDAGLYRFHADWIEKAMT